ncbi:hypothetical protein GN958_ATG16060 [Phytophthora infestans]|uniref:Uncharacterized protein n=1 Tax=Phytophthora infestans TaxID=4787 RepID=A0A8S9U7C9_PHYIN|nr:hypothetical protein GN958_ATG16060 [Phytophthora infestans]
MIVHRGVVRSERLFLSLSKAVPIAFIDSFDQLLGGSDWDKSSTTTNIPEARNTKNAPMRKRKANPPGYTTRLQQQKKAELRGLRDHVRQLEEQVE